ncbi:MAG: glycosyltransferase [Candidatus Delongbacteria bacterium]|jgi:glycosyltransferase involved in cell wall biosynthesis|nr:glycosyltransferase [Candidatus Delongbacteria bacterium]
MMNVKVLLPVSSGDRLKYFKLALNSILTQTFSDFDVIICIDGVISEDIDLYINSLGDRRIMIMRNEDNIGLAATLNKAIRSYPSDIYFRMDSDDICNRRRFRRTLEEFENDEDILLIGTECIEIDDDGTEIFYKKMPFQAQIKKWAISRNPFIHPSVAFRKEFFDIVGYYNESFKKSQDYELWSRAIVKNVKMNNIHEPLIWFRVSNKFWINRTLRSNVRNELKVSFFLIKKFNGYIYLPKILMKALLRFMPVWFNKLMYKYGR